MNKQYCYKILIIMLPLIMAIGAHVIFFCERVSNAKNGLHIVCTTGMIGDLVQHIVGDLASVTVLMGPGVDPHLYHARESDIRAIMGADLVFYNGLHLEGKMTELLESLPSSIRVQSVASAIPSGLLIPTDYQGLYDPHIWHDVSLWLMIVEYVTNILVDRCPVHADALRSAALAYKAQLSDLHNYVQHCIAQIPACARILVTAHDAFSYFGKAYGVTVIGLQGINTEVEPSIKDIQHLVNNLMMHGIHAIFLEASIPPRTMNAVNAACAAHNWPLIIGQELFSDALGDRQEGGETYCTMIRHNCDIIVSTLCRSYILHESVHL